MSTTLPALGYGAWAAAPVVSAATARSPKWMAWIEAVRTELLRSSGQGFFFANHWATHAPALFDVQPLPAMGWTLDSLRRCGAADTEVEVQAGRLAAARDISYTEVSLTPGKALFIPVGWWHCIKSIGVSVTYTSTNFPWPNDWVEGFPSN